MKNYKLHRLILAITFLLINNHYLFSQSTVVDIKNPSKQYLIGKALEIFIDKKNEFTKYNIEKAEFKKSNSQIPIFNASNQSYWIKFKVKNQTSSSLFLNLQYPNISHIEFYKLLNKNLSKIEETGNSFKYYQRKYDNENFVFPLDLAKQDSSVYFITIKSNHPLLLPLSISSEKALLKKTNNENIIISVYVGILIALSLYNLVLYFFTKDSSYLQYVFYLFFIGLAQLSISGYTAKYIWPNIPVFNDYSLVILSSFAGISGIIFSKQFLQIKNFLPWVNKILSSGLIIYILSISSNIFHFNNVAYNLLNFNAIFVGLTLLIASAYISKKGFKSAYFYSIAWSIFLGGVIIFALRNFSLLPYNTFTNYISYFGSAVEAILLSIALADKINVLRKEKEVSQAQALRISQENATLIQEQNIVLEQKVSERTEELEETNHQLSQTLNDLKEAQTQLVEAEKMASLGQLTAGIAHEINNPINFVKSNIKPLQLDINDLLMVIDEYDELHNLKNGEIDSRLKRISGLKDEIDIEYVKTEIKKLIKGIEEGAERTAEIVRGLRTFSRLDESELKTANIHEGIESTLILLKNGLPPNVKIIKNFTADGNIECYPGKLNQVFMNIINNGLQAIQSKKEQNEVENIIIQTRDVHGKIEISIKDTGTGMTEEVKQKVFEPFFTTKDVGEGTGLGMAIVFKIIEKHNAKINIISSPGNGAEFILTLPYLQPIS